MSGEGGVLECTAKHRHLPCCYSGIMSHLPVLLQLAMTQRRDVVALKLLVLARILLLRFAHCEETGLDPRSRRRSRRFLLRRLINCLGHLALQLRFHFRSAHVVVHLLRFFSPLVALLRREGGVGGAFVCIEVGKGEFEGLALGLLGWGGVFGVSSAAVEGRGVEGSVGAGWEKRFSSRWC